MTTQCIYTEQAIYHLLHKFACHRATDPVVYALPFVYVYMPCKSTMEHNKLLMSFQCSATSNHFCIPGNSITQFTQYRAVVKM